MAGNYDGSLKFDTKIDTSGFKSGLSGLSSVVKVGAAAVTAAIAAIGVAVFAIGKQAVEAYADYEQFVGGIETLFGAGGATLEEYAARVGKTVDEASAEFKSLEEAQTLAMENANQAYKTAGLSANQYMEQITAFSASLKQSLNGDTVAAAKVGDMAIQDMADNANKMGTAMGDIQNAYQGFAKQNYTMLDNLKLGYGGTKTEMERLLADAEKITGIKYDISNLNEVFEAIHVIQGELGITGTTALEAATTIQGSTAMMKAAWQNLLVGIGDDTQDFDQLLRNFIDSVGTFAENLLPRIVIVFNGIGKLISQLAPIIAKALPKLAAEILPKLIQTSNEFLSALLSSFTESSSEIGEASLLMMTTLGEAITTNLPLILQCGIMLLSNFLQGIVDMLPTLIPMAVTMINTLANGLMENLPLIITCGLQILAGLITGLAEALPTLIPIALEMLITIITTLIDNLELILDAGLQLLTGLADGIINAIPVLIERLPQIITSIINFITENLPKIIESGVSIVVQLAVGLIKAIPQLVAKLPEIISAIVNGFSDAKNKFMDIGKDIVKGIWDGIQSLAAWIGEKVSSFVSNLFESAKSAIGFGSGSSGGGGGSRMAPVMASGDDAMGILRASAIIPENQLTVATRATNFRDTVKKGVENALSSVSGALSTVSGVSVGKEPIVYNNTVNNYFEQTNISPEATSPAEIARSAEDMLYRAKNWGIG